MTDADDTTSLQAQLAAHRRTLAMLLRQLTSLSADYAPPARTGDLQVALATARDEIARLKAALRAAGVAVEEQEGDVAAPDEMNVIARPHAGDAVSGDKVGGDKVGGDKIGGDKITIGTAYFQGASTALPIDTAAAQAALASLPTDDIPEPAPLPPGSRMLLRRNPLFVGREADLRAIAQVLNGATPLPRTGAGPGVRAIAAITTGIGGVGKTQLAAEFAHRYGQFFAGGVFWLSFAEQETQANEQRDADHKTGQAGQKPPQPEPPADRCAFDRHWYHH